MALVQTLTGAGPVTLRQAARRVGRDVRAAHSDVHMLLQAGVLRNDEDGTRSSSRTPQCTSTSWLRPRRRRPRAWAIDRDHGGVGRSASRSAAVPWCVDRVLPAFNGLSRFAGL